MGRRSGAWESLTFFGLSENQVRAEYLNLESTRRRSGRTAGYGAHHSRTDLLGLARICGVGHSRKVTAYVTSHSRVIVAVPGNGAAESNYGVGIDLTSADACALSPARRG